MKFIFICMLFFTTMNVFGQNEELNYVVIITPHIKYKSLQYSDFKKNMHIDDTSYFHYAYRHHDSLKYVLKHHDWKWETFFQPVAASSLDIATYYDFYGDTLQYEIHSRFYPDSSFMIVNTLDLLNHEQIHFNIYELHSREIKKYLYLNSGDTIGLDSMIYVCEQRNKSMNDSFEKDVYVDRDRRGVTAKKNEIWLTFTNDRLNSLKEYSQPEGFIVLTDAVKRKMQMRQRARKGKTIKK